MRRASAAFSAIGFSTRTCLPAAAAARTYCRWESGGVATYTMSTLPLPITAPASSVHSRTACRRAKSRAAAPSRHIATTMRLRSAAMIDGPLLCSTTSPQPTTPQRNGAAPVSAIGVPAGAACVLRHAAAADAIPAQRHRGCRCRQCHHCPRRLPASVTDLPPGRRARHPGRPAPCPGPTASACSAPPRGGRRAAAAAARETRQACAPVAGPPPRPPACPSP